MATIARGTDVQLGSNPTTTLLGPGGGQLVLPPEVFAVLRGVVEAMAEGQGVMIAPVHQRLTTQEAADLLGSSRSTLVKLLEAGQIRFEHQGGTAGSASRMSSRTRRSILRNAGCARSDGRHR